MILAGIPGIESPEEIGRGARGIVYRAQRKGQTVAVKVALDAQADLREASLWFRREGVILACVNHPGLAEIIEVGEVDGRPYLVREYVRGRTIASDLASGPLQLDRLVGAARMVAGALAQVHRHGLVHRDVKPQNIILLDHQMGAKLIDFGLATRFERGAPREIAGTLLYSAPEQTGMLKRPVDGRADLYALGVVMFEAASGQLPFQSDDVGEVIRAHAVVKPPDLRQLKPGLPDLLVLIIEKLLAKDPDDRYQTGSGLAADLERLFGPHSLLRLGEQDQEAPTAFEPHYAGREEDLDELLAVWASVLDSRSRVVLIEGEPGSGKSRLVRELFSRISASSPMLVGARCLPGDPPLRPLREAAESYLDRLDRLPTQEAWGARLQMRLASGSAGLLARLSPRLAPHLETSGPEPPPEEDADRFYQAVADWFLRLADNHPGTVLFLDDLQWIDEASREVIRRVMLGMGSKPVLLLGCMRDNEESLRRAERMFQTTAARPLRMRLAPLGERAVGRLIASHLGGRNVDEELVRILAVRTRGNPFFVGEYIRAMLDGGLLRPSGSHWLFEAEGLERLALASDVLNLVLERLAELSPETRQVLELAAVWGQRSFELSMLIKLAPELEAAEGVEQALELRLIDRTEAGQYVFSHDRIREALLGGLDPEVRSLLHRRLGEYLEEVGAPTPEHIFARARHLAAGQSSPQRIYETSLAAGRVALEQFAFEQSYRFLRQAARSGRPTGAEAADLKEMLARVCLATNRLEEASDQLAQALDHTREPVQRARLWEQRSLVHLSQYHVSEARYDVERAFAEIGGPGRSLRPVRRLAGALRTLLFIALDATVPRPSLAAAAREQLKIRARLLEHTGYVHWFEHDLDSMAEVGGRLVLDAWRLGPSRELVRAYAKAAYYGGILGLSWMVRRYVERGEALARDLADPVALAHIGLFHGLSLHQLGLAREAEPLIRRQLEDPARWLDALDFSLGCTALITSLLLRGYTREAERWVERALDRQQVSSGRQSPIEKLNLLCHRLCISSFEGRTLEAVEQLEQVRRQLAEPERVRDLATNLYSFTIHLYLEQEDLGPRLDEALSRFQALRARPAKIPLNRRHGFIFQAYARLAQVEHAQGRRELLQHAIGQLRQAATAPFLTCHLLVVEAAWMRLHGRTKEALQRLAEAELMAGRVDSPWAMLEIAWERARVLADSGNREVSVHQARMAYNLAEELGWSGRARRIRCQLLPSTSLTASGSRSRSRESEGRLARPERHLDALVQVSLASGSMLDPKRQAQVCLDEMIRLLGAERGFLFLTRRDGGLETLCGRDATGGELAPLEGYSTTVVEQVQATHQPVVLSGSEQGALLGSESVVALDLRSILAAPLIVRGKTIGIVYLDNRLARGIFTNEDVGITMALCNQVAITLENARAAALEASLQAERRQRDLAESVRDLTSVLGSTLEITEVLTYLLESLERTVPYELARALLPDGDGFSCVVERGAVGRGSPLPRELLRDLVQDPRPVHVMDLWRDPRFVSEGTPSRAWLAVPVVSRGEVGVLIVLEHSTPGVYNESLAELALTFSGQAGVALENARLFAQVRKLASTDELTGLYNRRHFLELGRLECSRAQRHGYPLAAIMLDVDHFKSINDTYGHAAGDHVLRAVAQICRETLRTEDLLGRYGGEEFAFLLPSTPTEHAHCVLGERLRAAIEEHPMLVAGRRIQVTASLGIAGFTPEADLTQLLNRADQALYQAKNAGRNRVVLAGPDPESC